MEYSVLKFFLRSYLYVEPDGDLQLAISDYDCDRGNKAVIELGKEVQELLALLPDKFRETIAVEELLIVAESPDIMHKLMWELLEHLRSFTNQKWF